MVNEAALCLSEGVVEGDADGGVRRRERRRARPAYSGRRDRGPRPVHQVVHHLDAAGGQQRRHRALGGRTAQAGTHRQDRRDREPQAAAVREHADPEQGCGRRPGRHPAPDEPALPGVQPRPPPSHDRHRARPGRQACATAVQKSSKPSSGPVIARWVSSTATVSRAGSTYAVVPVPPVQPQRPAACHGRAASTSTPVPSPHDSPGRGTPARTAAARRRARPPSSARPRPG